MRTATIMLVAVLTAAAVGARAYGLETPGGIPGAGDATDRGISAGFADRTTFTILAEDNSSADPLTADALAGSMPASGTTAEIPPVPPRVDPLDPSPAADDGQNSSESAQDPQATDDQQTPDEGVQAEVPPHVYSLQDFVNQGLDESPIGVELREDCSRLETREKVCGLAVLEVRNGSPAAKAGIKRYTALTHDLLDGASVAAALVFPPAIVAVAVIDQSGIGESFDLVIGVDGRRVRHILDFQDLTANVRPGDILYLTVVRSGKRLQIPVHLPSDGATARN